MLHARKNAAYTYVFIRVVPALTIVISAVIGNNMAVRESPKKIVSETAYAALILAVAQARSSFVDPIAA
jgi:hypothetical protein